MMMMMSRTMTERRINGSNLDPALEMACISHHRQVCFRKSVCVMQYLVILERGYPMTTALIDEL